jgi:peptide/nickel transport system permease protein
VTRGAAGGLIVLGTLAIVAAAAPWLAPTDPFAVAGPALAGPTWAHPFGTDDLGRDVYSGVVHGAATSLRVGFAAALCSTLIGLAIGGFAGMRSGLPDVIAMRATEFVQAIPRFFLVVMVVSLFGGHVWLIVLVIGLTAWPATARVFRAQVMSTIARDFILAARAAGSGDAAILIRHVLPITITVVAAQVSYQVGGAILAEAGLSFLGLGDPTVISWGTLLGTASHTAREAWWIAVFPGLAVTLTVLGCNLLADSLVRREDG